MNELDCIVDELNKVSKRRTELLNKIIDIYPNKVKSSQRGLVNGPVKNYETFTISNNPSTRFCNYEVMINGNYVEIDCATFDKKSLIKALNDIYVDNKDYTGYHSIGSTQFIMEAFRNYLRVTIGNHVDKHNFAHEDCKQLLKWLENN